MTHSLSVCLPNYNGAGFIHRALDAVLAQSYRPLEILVLDDGSTDASIELLEAYERAEPSLRVLRHETNQGVLAAILRLIEAAQGTHIHFAAIDDMVLPGLFQRCMEILERHPTAGLCSSLTNVIDAEGSDRGIFPSPVVAADAAFIPPAGIRKLLPTGMLDWFVLGNTAVYSLDAVRRLAPRCVQLGPYFDGFMSQLVALERGACFIAEPLACWRVAGESYSGQLRSDRRWQRMVADEAYELMTGDFSHLFPPGYAGTWRRELLVQSELEDGEVLGKLARLRREAAARRRHGLPLGPAAARRVRLRVHARRRRRIARRAGATAR